LIKQKTESTGRPTRLAVLYKAQSASYITRAAVVSLLDSAP